MRFFEIRIEIELKVSNFQVFGINSNSFLDCEENRWDGSKHRKLNSGEETSNNDGISFCALLTKSTLECNFAQRPSFTQK